MITVRSSELDYWAKRLPNEAGIAATLGRRNDTEQNYALAYQNMVRRGHAPQLRGKYRV